MWLALPSYSPAVDGMSGAAGEDGLMLDELSRERLAEGHQLLAAMLGEHDSMRQGIRKGPFPLGEVDPIALRAYEKWDPADQFSCLTVEQLRCLLFAAAERLTNEPAGPRRRGGRRRRSPLRARPAARRGIGGSWADLRRTGSG